MKCLNCKKNNAEYVFCGSFYCYDCMMGYVIDECLTDAIDLWIEQHTKMLNHRVKKE